MKRSSGITVSSIFVFIGSGATLLFAAIMVAAGLLAGAEAKQAAFMKYMMFVIAAIEAGFAAWGVASAVGLLRVREWARISMLVFSALLLLMSVPGFAIILVMPLQMPPSATDPELANHVLLATRVGMCIFYAALIAIAAFWLYFFNSRSVRDQFKGFAALASGTGAVVAAERSTNFVVSTEVTSPSAHRRPLSVSIIGYYLLISAPLVGIFFFIKFPVLILWFLLRGPKATAALLAFCIAQVVMGVGLLKLREWARILTISYFAFIALNSLTMALVPSAQARYQEAQVEIQSAMSNSMAGFGTTPAPMHIPVWIGLIFSLPLIAVVLWFLSASKPAFVPSTHQSSA
jgi:hypothetical protein